MSEQTESANAKTPATTPARRVVVAEDETLIRLDIIEILRGEGYDVVGEADNGEKAVQLAEELRPDLVLMDVKMPVMDGISAAEKIVKARIAPVVLLTAFSQRELVERARDAGAMAYVVKPFSPADLIPAIEIALSRHDEIKALEEEVDDLQEQFATRKLVERAKSLLTTKMGLTEPEAFRWIQKTSMDRRLSMREVAETIINQVN
ncbi:MAG TPA: response regulator [Chloroflexota bacterium]|nr:response regulator [Actinomycetota bacterium]HEV7215286.1 response regulator [Chloroflexota bacterium]